MNIVKKMEYAKTFIKTTEPYSKHKCEDIVVLENHIIYKIKDNGGAIDILKFSINEILNSVTNSNEHVYCTNCAYGKDLINSINDESSPEPTQCTSCYPYDFEDSVPLNKRPNYKPL